MLRDGAFSLVSTVVRLMTSLVLFVLMAHAWGPAAFGTFMYPYTVAAVLVKVVDYGFAVQVVRDVGRAPGRAHEITARALGAKLVLVVPMLAITAALVAGAGGDAGRALLLGLLVGDALVNSFALFLNLPLRALGFFDREARVATWSNAALFAVVAALVYAGYGPLAAAAAFVAARLVYLAASWRAYRRTVGAAPAAALARDAVLPTLTAGFPFGVHVAVGTLNLHTDTLMLQHYLGAAAVGVYQGGMRVLLGALLIADALNGVYLARAARASHDPVALGRLGTQMTRHLLALGLIAFACTVGGSEWIVRLLFHRAGYEPLVGLLPLFGLLALIRYAGVSYGTLLTLADKQGVRVAAVCGVLALSLALNAALIPRLGLAGAITASILGHVTLYGVYAAAGWRDRRTLLLDARSAGLLLAALALAAIAFVARLVVPAQLARVAPLLLSAALVPLSVALGVTRGEWGVLSRKLARTT